MIALIFAWLLAMLAGQPAPAAPAMTPAPPSHVVAHAGEAHAPGDHPGALSSPRIGGTSPSPRPATPTVAADPEPAPQDPDEVIGRQIDCPDGTVGTVVDADLDTSCP